MKKRLLLLAIFTTGSLLKAQIPNASFENLNSDGSIKHWGAMILIAVTLDSTGHATDSVKMDGGFYFSTNDAHTGAKALEMNNAYYYVSGQKIGGLAFLRENDTTYTNFGTILPFFQKPVNFSFYYKFLPAGADTANGWLRLTDSSSNIVGEASIDIHGTHNVYTLASTPIVYSSTVNPAFIEVGFSTSRNYSEPNFGTRFLVDDVNTTISTTGINPLTLQNDPLSCFPNPAEQEVNLRLKKSMENGYLKLQILNTEGKQIENISYEPNGDLLKINTELLPKGLYFINVIHAGYTYTAKFIK